VDTEENENLKDTIHRLVDGLQLENFQDMHIDRAHRLPTRNKQRQETILIQFKTREYRDAWLMGKQGRITNDDIFENGNNGRIFVNEHLTPFYKTLIWKTKQELKSSFKFIWFKEGKIQLRKNENERQIFTIKSEEELNKLVAKTILEKNSNNNG
jgi:hypothetical protein